MEVCLEGVRSRRGKPRSDIPWVETAEDPAFMQFIRDFATQRRPQILALFAKYPEKTIHIFRSRQQATHYLETL